MPRRDDYDRPRRRKRRPPAGPPAWLIVVGVAGVVAVTTVGVWLASRAVGPGKLPAVPALPGVPNLAGPAAPVPPAGWALVEDLAYRVVMPGEVYPGVYKDDAHERQETAELAAMGIAAHRWWVNVTPPAAGERSAVVYRAHVIEYRDRPPGTSAADLMRAAERFTGDAFHPDFHDLRPEPVTTGGRPGVQVVSREKGNKQFPKVRLIRLVPDGRRLFVLDVIREGRDPDPAAAKVFFDSFRVR